MLGKTNRVESNNTVDVEHVISSIGLDSGKFRIEEFWSAIDDLESKQDCQWVRMDFGVPGLHPPECAVAAHQQTVSAKQALQTYPPSTGVEELKTAFATFLTRRLTTLIAAENTFVTCGATHALFIAQAISAKLNPQRSAIAFLTPNYPPMHVQAQFLGMANQAIETDGKRGKALLDAIRTVFETNTVAAFCWASPSNPSWMILNHEELVGIAELCKAFNVIPIEDLTYLGMINSKQPLHDRVPSISRYAEDYFLVISTSKMLSYAGERVGLLVGSPHLLATESEKLRESLGVTSVRRACSSLIFNLTGGASHSAQYAIAAAIQAINADQYPLEERLSIYIERAHALIKILINNNFYIINSLSKEKKEEQKSDEQSKGFYVNFGYSGLSELELVEHLLRVGVAVLPLSIFGSQRNDAVRACVGRLDEEKLVRLQQSLRRFNDCQNY